MYALVVRETFPASSRERISHNQQGKLPGRAASTQWASVCATLSRGERR